jgi:toxin ParE1/3/4
MNFFFSKDAENDLEESGLYYNNERFGLGLEFLDEVYAAISCICKNPSIWKIVYRDLQRYSIDRFPFQIIYRVQSDVVEIIAINHNKRHPKSWKKRL